MAYSESKMSFYKIKELYNTELIKAKDVIHSISRHMHGVWCVCIMKKGPEKYFVKDQHTLPPPDK